MANEYNIINQDYVDNLVQKTASLTVDLAVKVVSLRVQQDPDWWRMGQALMAIQSLTWSIRDYDITADIFTEQELMYIEELIMQLIQSCPLPA